MFAAASDAREQPASKAGAANPKISGVPSAKFTLSLDSDNMMRILLKLTGQYSARICFEDLDWDMEKDTISLRDVIDDLERTAKTRDLSPAEKSRLEIGRSLLASGVSPGSLFGKKEKCSSGTFEASSIDGLLDIFTRESSYSWTKSNGTYTVFPRSGSLLTFSVSISVEDAPLWDVLRQLVAQQPPNLHIFVSRGVELGPERTDKRDGARVKKLDLKSVPASEALCRVVEAAGGEFYWYLAGYKGSRSLGVVAIRGDASK
jgi:hypothetical protein